MTPKVDSARSPRLIATLKDDFHVVVEDIQRRGIRRSVSDTLTNLEAFYLTAEDRRQLAALPAVRRYLRRIWWLVKSLLMKLTPARRIMLTVAFLLLITGQQRIDFEAARMSIRFPVIVSFLLLFVLMLELKDKLVARDELEAGRAVQLALMPGQTPDVPGWQVWLYSRPANDVGGDLVDHLAIDPRHHFVALGDVAGKALPAALLAVKLQATLRALAPNFEHLGDLGAAVNHILQRDGLPSKFASLVYLALTTDSGHVRLLNAGHMPPIVVRDGAVTQLDRGSMVLGMMPNVTFDEQQVDFGSGDTMIVYSDGVSEATSETGDFFGDERVMAIAKDTAGRPVAEVGDRVIQAVAGFVGDALPSDDVSLIVLRRV